MTETLHRPFNAKEATRALRLKQVEVPTTIDESFSDSLDIHDPALGAIEQKLASIQEYSSETNESSSDDFSTEQSLPRMTDSLKQSLQEFTLESRGRGKDLHTEALKDYRKRDINGYIDHLAGLADDQNLSVTPEARDEGKKLLGREERKADRQEFRDELIQKADKTQRFIGRAAVKAGFIGLGIAKLGYNKAESKVWEKTFAIDGKVANWRSQRSYEKATARLEKESAKTYKDLDKQAARDQKRGARYDRAFERSMKRKQTGEKVVNTIEQSVQKAVRTKRRLGSFAAKMEATGRGHK